MSNIQKASCNCGKVGFEIALENLNCGICHCESCRKLTSSFYNSVAYHGEINFTNSDSIQIYDSSPWAERGFCKNCGSVLFYKLKDKHEYHIAAGIFENYKNFALKTQMFVDIKPDYLTLKANTENMTRQECFDKWG